MAKGAQNVSVYQDNAHNRRMGRVGQPKKIEGAETEKEREAFKEVRTKNEKAILSLEIGESHDMKSKDDKLYRATRSQDGSKLTFFVVDENTRKQKKVKEISFKEKKLKKT
jgi:hypothetical protein